MCCTPPCPLHHQILKSFHLQRFLYQIPYHHGHHHTRLHLLQHVSSTISTKHPRTFTSTLEHNRNLSFFCVEYPLPHQIDLPYCSHSMQQFSHLVTYFFDVPYRPALATLNNFFFLINISIHVPQYSNLRVQGNVINRKFQ